MSYNYVSCIRVHIKVRPTLLVSYSYSIRLFAESCHWQRWVVSLKWRASSPLLYEESPSFFTSVVYTVLKRQLFLFSFRALEEWIYSAIFHWATLNLMASTTVITPVIYDGKELKEKSFYTWKPIRSWGENFSKWKCFAAFTFSLRPYEFLCKSPVLPWHPRPLQF